MWEALFVISFILLGCGIDSIGREPGAVLTLAVTAAVAIASAAVIGSGGDWT